MAARSRHHDPEEAHWRGRPLRPVDMDGLRDHGVPGPRVNWCLGAFEPLLRQAIVFRRGPRFEFVRNLRGDPVEPVAAYTLLARDVGGAPIDVVGWHPRSGRLATWLGRIGLLGIDYPCPATKADPLCVFSKPTEWLAAGRRGVVVVDERLARAELLEAGTIQATDIEHGTKLKAMLERVTLPGIVVPAASIGQVAA